MKALTGVEKRLAVTNIMRELKNRRTYMTDADYRDVARAVAGLCSEEATAADTRARDADRAARVRAACDCGVNENPTWSHTPFCPSRNVT